MMLGKDLIVLPEMFPTGYCVDPRGVADSRGEVLEWMRDEARKRDAAVVGSVAVEEDGRYYNRMFFVRPDGTWDQYDKRHLFSFAGEHRAYTAGTEKVVVEWRGWRILLQVCYDLRFPVFSRNGGGAENAYYDMIVYSAEWPEARIGAWNVLLRARAIENACYVVGVNGHVSRPAGGGDAGRLLDGSQDGGHRGALDDRGFVLPAVAKTDFDTVQLIDFKGNELPPDTELDLEALRAFRRKFPALDDADAFRLRI